jgi:hypothetical protein
MNHKFQCSPSVENVTFAQRLGQLTRLLFQLGSRRKQVVLKKSRANFSRAGVEADRDQAAHVQAAQSEHYEPPKVSRIGRRPPRCTERPFRWKDIYILSDSRNLINYWSLFHVAIACGLVTLLFTVMDARERHFFSVVYACIAYAGWWFIIAIRFDALLTAEFRERTWGSLMLLPVDPHHMLIEKVVAAFWEQRFALLPVAIAVVSLLMWGTAQSFMVFVMTVIIASLVSAILCQMTCITQLISKNWWIGPAQIIGFTTVGGVVISIWISCGPVPGFILSALALGIVVVFVQKVIVDPLVNNWVEP